jgi:hypothetical protein
MTENLLVHLCTKSYAKDVGEIDTRLAKVGRVPFNRILIGISLRIRGIHTQRRNKINCRRLFDEIGLGSKPK